MNSKKRKTYYDLNLTARLYLRLTALDLHALDRCAVKLGLERSEIARRALRSGLELFIEEQNSRSIAKSPSCPTEL